MPYCDVYIGDLDDPKFTWTPNDDQWSGNFPKALTRRFPPEGHDPFFTVMRRIESGEYFGKQTDWGTWVAIVTKEQIEEYIQEFFGNYMAGKEEFFGHLIIQLDEIKEVVKKLDPNKKYGLVAMET